MKNILEIRKYDISYYAGSDPERARYRAMIGLRDKKGKAVGIAYFHPDGMTMPSAMLTDSGLIVLHYPASHFPAVVDLLRNERPVFLRYTAGEPPTVSIDTALEPVGEGNEARA